MDLSKKKILITGAGSGMGRELALALLKKDAHIAAVDINEKTLKETLSLAGDKGKNVSIHVANLADKAAVEALPEQVLAKHKHIDVIINNAGIIQPFVKVKDLDYSAIERVMNVNFYGTLYMVKAFLPHLLKRPEAYIANVSSMGGFLPVPGQSIYGASKAAVKLMTEGLYAELHDTNIHVSVIYPGAIATNITDNSGVKASHTAEENTDKKKKTGMKPLPADEAAIIIINGMEKNKVRIYVGKDSKTMNFLYRLNPGYATNMITKAMKDLLSD